ncbi:MAG: hypothetical protein FJX75_08860 [Armatimonadetes bacterium]|nr:hypothetical protein [Armatimonadota bacterium]
MPKKLARGAPAATPQGRPDEVPVACLRVDPQNPRLLSTVGAETGSQEDLIRTLWTDMAVAEVAQSIAVNGYFPYERLFVVPAADGNGAYDVVEGNRRLAAVLLLRDSSLRRRVGATELDQFLRGGHEPPDRLPVLEFRTREDLWAYIGFQHVAGVKRWDSYSKAAYVARVHEEYDRPLDEIARSIADQHSTVRRLYRGFAILRQAEEGGLFDRQDQARSRFYFSHLYTAADYREFQEFLGVDPDAPPKRAPVPKSRRAQLANLMLWLYGSRSQNRPPLIQTQHRDMALLRQAISTPRGVVALEAGLPLRRAFEISVGDDRRFADMLLQAREYLQQAMRLVATGYKGEEDPWRTLTGILKTTDTLHELMRQEHERRRARSGKAR